jgi:hypothetical protein
MIKRVFLISLCLMPLIAFAQPSTQRNKPLRPGPPMKKPATRPTSRPSEDPLEFDKALAFLEKVSPNRSKAYQSLDEDRRGIFHDRIIAFYRGNQWMNKDPELWKVREKVIKAEDDVFGIRWEILANGGLRRATDEDKARLKNAVAVMVKMQLQDRSLRLERWKKWVNSEEDQIGGISANMDDYVDQRYRDELAGKGLGLFDHPRMQGGGPGGPGGGPGGGGNPPGTQKGNEKPQPAK